MLKKQVLQYIEANTELQLFDFEQQYIETNAINVEGKKMVDKAYTMDFIERCSKETEEAIATETAEFLATPIQYLKENQGEFVYAESASFDLICIDAIALEFDEAFNLYTALFGLKLQKKHSEAIRGFLKANVKSKLGSSSASFAGQEGIWELNVALDCIEGFREDMTLQEIYTLLYRFVFDLNVAAEA